MHQTRNKSSILDTFFPAGCWWLATGLLWLGGGRIEAEGIQAKLLEVRKIWDAAPHNAFTDLEYYKGQWFCAFREGSGHAQKGDYGKVRILHSKEGEVWESAGLLESKGLDLRDAKLSITPGGELLLNSVEYDVDRQDAQRRNNQSVVFLSSNGMDWSPPRRVADFGYWLWQTTWKGHQGLALGYQWGAQDRTRLYRTTDGREYELWVDHLRPPGDKSNEHAMVFTADERAIMLLRRDHAGEFASEQSARALLGKAAPPYRDWEWQRLNVKVGGPSLCLLSSGHLLAAVRRYPQADGTRWQEQWTELGWIDVEEAHYHPLLKLPSGGDSSYPGMVMRNGLLWMSYYSSHEGKTSIYLAKIALEFP